MSITMRSAYQGFYDEADDLTAPIYKCILVGDVNAGKTTFYERFKSGRYYDPPDEDEEDPNEGRMYSEDGIAECCRMFSFAGFTGKVSGYFAQSFFRESVCVFQKVFLFSKC